MPQEAPMKLSELTGMIRDTLNNKFARESYWVLADISDHKFNPQKKFHYFEMVEKGDSGNMVTRIQASAWGEGGKSVEVFEKETGQKFTTGIHVLARVRVEYHILYGLKLTLLELDTRFTLGELEKKKQETIKRLLAECPDYIRMVGDRIVTRNQGHALKLVLQRIAVVGSKQSAGYQDFVHTLRSNPYGYLFTIDAYHTQVQGEANAGEVLKQLISVFHSGKPYDAVVIIRGGGAETDFLIFNDFNLSRAVAKFPIPIITGIGHLKDQSIADLMAHTETKTPTKSAEFIITHNKHFEDKVLELQNNVLIRAQQMFSTRQRMLTSLNSIVVNKSRDYLQRYMQEMIKLNRVVTQTSMQIIHARHNEMVSLSGRVISPAKVMMGRRSHELQQMISNLGTFRAMFLKRQQGFLDHHKIMIRMASPEQTLQRGFAIVKMKDRIVANADKISKGDEIVVVMHKTEITSIVKAKKETDGSANNI